MKQLKFLILALLFAANPLIEVFAQELDKQIDTLIQAEFNDPNQQVAYLW